MPYFERFPYTTYQFPGNIIRRFKDISLRPAIVDEFFEDPSNLQEFVVNEGDTPEIVSYNEYGTVDLHWVILLANNIYNIYTDWPMSQEAFDSYLLEKYRTQLDSEGVERVLTDRQVREFLEFVGLPEDQYRSNIHLHDSDNGPKIVLRPHHFVDSDGVEYSLESLSITVDASGKSINLPDLTPVSNYEYENNINIAKRTIYLPYQSAAERLDRELRNILNE